ncbi:SAM-dependent methyltransferase-like protein [Oleiphilus messinensis]|uniref:SAM-dependent methyltransferase-like protein n=1 Tax=Oleiphilus messinensis TaxID=141451 RepID=A0A1Y0I815_9GAMM|nr:class I SAM-dependent methyltransferase [Oleiphilus messinensis]ARU56339.1 SAM-dependent methyltransferase-like protein [Oleiphilus messinensis]
MNNTEKVLRETSENIARLGHESGRVFHGRGKCFPGFENINIEKFNDDLLIALFPGWQNESFQLDAFQNALNTLISTTSGRVLTHFRDQQPCTVQNQQGDPVSEQVEILEDGIRYLVEYGENRNLGFFSDIKTGRRWVRDHAAEKRVLNLFSYTSSFSLAALSGGARFCANVDMSAAVISRGEHNHRLNGIEQRRYGHFKYNILKSWKKIAQKGPYDLVIVDPPSFQRGSFIASKDYGKVSGRLASMLSDDADILFCLNDPFVTEEVFREIIEASGPYVFCSRLENDSAIKELDGNGLKVLHYRNVNSPVAVHTRP